MSFRLSGKSRVFGAFAAACLFGAPATASFAVLAIVSSVTTASAAAIPGLFDTGVAADGTTLLSNGAADTHYALQGGGSAIVYQQGYPGYPDARFLGASAGGGYSQNPNTYSLSFSLAGLDYTTAQITGRASVDDQLSIYLNGGAIPVFTTDLNQTFPQFTIASGFVAGLNTLTFVVTDIFGPPSGFTILGLQGTASALQAVAVPGPIAGAGLIPLFGLAGVWYARNRRQAAA